MAAEGLPAGAPSPWELEAWYQDLQEVLAAAEPSGAPEQPALCGAGGPGPCGLDAALAAELLQLLGPGSGAGPEPAPPGAAGAPPRQEVKRQRGGGGAASRERARQRERAGQQRVLELTAHNERLRAEIQRLSTEVQRTRAALIDRIVNLRRA